MTMTKEELENKKLTLEIKKMITPWYKNIEFWKVVIPTLAVLFSLYFTFGRGLIDFERSKLEIQKEQLRLDITRFEMKSDALKISIEAKDSLRNVLENQIRLLSIQKNNLNDSTKLFISRLNDLNSKLSQTNRDRAKDVKFYQNQLSKEYELEKIRLNELKELKSQLNQKIAQNEIAIAEIEFLKKRIKLSDSEKFDLEMLKLTTSIEQRQKQINAYENSLKELKNNFDREKERINKLSDEELAKELELILLKMEVDSIKK
jgi:chromosome segregation ATPase